VQQLIVLPTATPGEFFRSTDDHPGGKHLLHLFDSARPGVVLLGFGVRNDEFFLTARWELMI
jgi:hypothetical protein